MPSVASSTNFNASKPLATSVGYSLHVTDLEVVPQLAAELAVAKQQHVVCDPEGDKKVAKKPTDSVGRVEPRTCSTGGSAPCDSSGVVSSASSLKLMLT